MPKVRFRFALLAALGALIAGALTAGGALSHPAARAASHRGGTFTMLAKSAADTADPMVDYTLQYWQLNQATYDGLTAYSKTGPGLGAELVPDLAVAIPKPGGGGKTWTFEIRKGIRYSTGATLKPADVKQSFERIFKVKGPTAGSFYIVIKGADACLKKPATCDLSAGIKVKGQKVTFTLTRPDPEFLDKLALPHASILAPTTPDKDIATDVSKIGGTGAYYWASYNPTKSIVLKRNKYFKQWSKLAQPDGYPDQIVQKFGLEVSDEVTAVINGEADEIFAADTIPPDRLNEISTKYPKQLHVQQLTADWYWALNTNIPPFNNLKARQAVNFAFDRNAAVTNFGGPQLATPTCQVLPAGFPGYEQYCPYTKNPAQGGRGPWTGADFAKAKKLVEESGTKGAAVDVVPANDEVQKNMGQYMQTLLTKLGYKATLKPLEAGLQYPFVQNSKNKVEVALSQWYQDYPAASDFLNVLTGCASFVPNSNASPNIAGFCDKQIDAKMQKALKLGITDQTAANKLWAQVDRDVTDQAPWVPMFNPKLTDFVSKRVGNYTFSKQYYFIVDQAWVQ